MDLGLGEQQQLLRRTARDFLEAECPVSLVREMESGREGYSPDLWKKMAGLGWLGLAIPTEYGGEGGSLIDQAALFEEIGRAMVPGPLLSSTVMAVQAILRGGSEGQKADLLPAIAAGGTIVTTALSQPSISPGDDTEITAIPNGRGYVLDGATLFVPFAHVADQILCIAGAQWQTAATRLLTAFLVDARSAGVTANLLDSVAGYKQHEVRFQQVEVGQEAAISPVGGASQVLDTAQQWSTVVQCAEKVGRSEKILEMVVDYSKNRVQFGRPIGSFQAVQHQCADLRVSIDGARLVTYQAAWKLEQGHPCNEDVSIAKAYAGSLSRQAAATGHGIFAGIAFTVEHDMQLYTMRSKIAEANLGDTDFHLDRLSAGMEL